MTVSVYVQVPVSGFGESESVPLITYIPAARGVSGTEVDIVPALLTASPTGLLVAENVTVPM